MATTELGGVAEVEAWIAEGQKSRLSRIVSGLWSFSRKKPLGAACGVVVLFFFLIGDAVPETLNKFASIAGLGKPVPYVADAMADHTGFLYRYYDQKPRDRLQGSSVKHLLGTDNIGRDTLSRLMYGARVAVMVSFGTVVISQTIAAAVGISSGFYGGWFDKLLNRYVDVSQALPGLVVLITIFGIWDANLWLMIIVFGVYGGPIVSRVIRSQAISVMASPFVESARIIGASDRRIMMRYVLPNVFPLLILSATVQLGFIVLLEAALSFLGYGLDPPFPTWGQMLNLEGRLYMRTQPGLALYPGLAIGLLVFSFNLFGDALRDVLDPRLRGSR